MPPISAKRQCTALKKNKEGEQGFIIKNMASRI
jgi:hypothetical protein